MDAEEIQHDNDCLVISIDIVDCPMAEIPLTEVFDVLTMSLLDNYHNVIRDSVLQQLEDTTWLERQSKSSLLRARYAVYHQRTESKLISLRKPALQRLITQALRYNSGVHHPIKVPVFIRFLMPDNALPSPQRHSSNKRNQTFFNDQRPTSRGVPNVVTLHSPLSHRSEALLDAPPRAAEAGYIIGSNHSDPVEVYRNDRSTTGDVTTTSPCYKQCRMLTGAFSNACCEIDYVQVSTSLLLQPESVRATTQTRSVAETVSPCVALADVIQSLLLSGNGPVVSLATVVTTQASSGPVAIATIGTPPINDIATPMPSWTANTLLSPLPPAAGNVTDGWATLGMPYVPGMAADGNRLLLPINMRFKPVDRGRPPTDV